MIYHLSRDFPISTFNNSQSILFKTFASKGMKVNLYLNSTIVTVCFHLCEKIKWEYYLLKFRHKLRNMESFLNSTLLGYVASYHNGKNREPTIYYVSSTKTHINDWLIIQYNGIL